MMLSGNGRQQTGVIPSAADGVLGPENCDNRQEQTTTGGEDTESTSYYDAIMRVADKAGGYLVISYISSGNDVDVKKIPFPRFGWWKQNFTKLLAWGCLIGSALLGVSELNRAILLLMHARSMPPIPKISDIYHYLDFAKLAQKAAYFLSVLSFIYATSWFASIATKLVVYHYKDQANRHLAHLYQQIRQDNTAIDQIDACFARYHKSEKLLIYWYLIDIVVVQLFSIVICLFGLAEALNALFLKPSVFPLLDFQSILPSHPMLIYSIIGLGIGLPIAFFSLVCEVVFIFDTLSRVSHHREIIKNNRANPVPAPSCGYQNVRLTTELPAVHLEEADRDPRGTPNIRGAEVEGDDLGSSNVKYRAISSDNTSVARTC